MSTEHESFEAVAELLRHPGTEKLPRSFHFTLPDGEGRLEVLPVFPGASFLLQQYRGSSNLFRHPPMPQIAEINFCLEGRIRWPLQNGRTIYLGPGDLSVHRMDCCSGSRQCFPSLYYRGLTLLLEPSVFRDHLPEALRSAGLDPEALILRFCGRRPLTVLPPDALRERLFAGLDQVPDAFRTAYFQLKAQELLLSLAFSAPEETAVKHPWPASTLEAIRNIHERLTSDLRQRPTIESLSREFLINTSTLKKAFKDVYGQPVAQYMKNLRMHRAADLLCRTSLTVGEIAQDLGYESQSKFATAFRSVMQIAPGDYRARYRKNQ